MGGHHPGTLVAVSRDNLFQRGNETSLVLQAFGKEKGAHPLIPLPVDPLPAAAVAGLRKVEIEFIGFFGNRLFQQFQRIGDNTREGFVLA